MLSQSTPGRLTPDAYGRPQGDLALVKGTTPTAGREARFRPIQDFGECMPNPWSEIVLSARSLSRSPGGRPDEFRGEAAHE